VFSIFSIHFGADRTMSEMAAFFAVRAYGSAAGKDPL
jgi:hypothetical protein